MANPQNPEQQGSAANLDKEEVARFSRISSEWWDPNGKFRPLHQIGPVRLAFIRDAATEHFGLQERVLRCLEGRTVLDIGCGGGLISEPLARLGASVTGIDPSEENIKVATAHALSQRLAIDYRTCQAEQLADGNNQFDVVVCLEVLEHVPDPSAFVSTCARLVKDDGLLVLSTLNRTLKSFALAIVGAEYILRWLPAGTHQWQKFIRPRELEECLGRAGFQAERTEGMVYNPLLDRWSRSPDTDVNYLMSATRSRP